MTAPQQAEIPKCKEWHVNRIVEEMDEVYYYISRWDDFFAKCPSEEIAKTIIDACSRPHTPAPSTDDAIPFSDWLTIHDTAIRKAEREKVLSFLDELISDRVSDARKREIVESLRTQQEQP